MSTQQSEGMDNYKKISKAYKEIVDMLTTRDLSHIKNYLSSLAKDIASKSNPVYAEFVDLRSMIDNLKEAKGKTPTHFAAVKGDVEIMRHLVETYKIDYKVKDKEGNTPFFTAVEHGHLQLVRYFIEELNVSPHTSKDGQISAIHLAANHNSISILEYLLEKGCDIEKVSIYGKPINWAVGSRHVEATKFLLEKGADANGDETCPAPAPLILAIDFNEQQIYNALLNAQKPANVNAKDPAGYTAMHVAAEKGSLKVMKELIARGANPNMEVEGKTPLYLAFENQKWEVVSYLKGLINDHADVEAKVKQAQKKAEEEKMAHPVDKEKANEIKNEGNKLYGEKNYEAALQKYTEALIYDNQNEIIHRNMAACYLPLKKYEEALKHCHKAKSIDAKNVKNLYREAQAYIGLNNLIEASTCLWQCAMLDQETGFFRLEFEKYFKLAKEQHQQKH